MGQLTAKQLPVLRQLRLLRQIPLASRAFDTPRDYLQIDAYAHDDTVEPTGLSANPASARDNTLTQQTELPRDVRDAVSKDDVKSVVTWLAQGGSVHATCASSDGSSVGGATLLHCAAKGGKTAIVRIALQRNACVDVQDEHGATALMVAASCLQFEVVAMLLAAGADGGHALEIMDDLMKSLNEYPSSSQDADDQCHQNYALMAALIRQQAWTQSEERRLGERIVQAVTDATSASSSCATCASPSAACPASSTAAALDDEEDARGIQARRPAKKKKKKAKSRASAAASEAVCAAVSEAGSEAGSEAARAAANEAVKTVADGDDEAANAGSGGAAHIGGDGDSELIQALGMMQLETVEPAPENMLAIPPTAVDAVPPTAIPLADVPDITGRDNVPESTIRGQSTCIVCFNNEKTHLAVPCGHQCVCSTCSARMERCPYCTADIIMWVQARIV
eukprot:4407042-Prymnesium_polylepis.2